MELLVCSLHGFLEPEARPENWKEPYYTCPLSTQYIIIDNVASGLDYLHHLSPQTVIHRDLSARNVLLTSSIEAKIADLGVAHLILPQIAATMTKAPVAFVYIHASRSYGNQVPEDRSK